MWRDMTAYPSLQGTWWFNELRHGGENCMLDMLSEDNSALVPKLHWLDTVWGLVTRVVNCLGHRVKHQAFLWLNQGGCLQIPNKHWGILKVLSTIQKKKLWCELVYNVKYFGRLTFDASSCHPHSSQFHVTLTWSADTSNRSVASLIKSCLWTACLHFFSTYYPKCSQFGAWAKQ